MRLRTFSVKREMVISRGRFAEKEKEIHRNKKAREGRAKLLFLAIKYANFVASLIKVNQLLKGLFPVVV